MYILMHADCSRYKLIPDIYVRYQHTSCGPPIKIRIIRTFSNASITLINAFNDLEITIALSGTITDNCILFYENLPNITAVSIRIS